MSVAEMKLLAFEKLAALQDESAIQEILTHLENLSQANSGKSYHLAQHFETIASKYGDVLEKLAK